MPERSPLLGKILPEPWKNAVFQTHGIRANVLRLDKIHPEISGNKWFKLKYYIEKAKAAKKNKLISFGGYYSNHLIALASAAKLYGFSARGLIRGEEPRVYSPFLTKAKSLGMELCFLSRRDYKIQKDIAFKNQEFTDDPFALMIPEGGAGLEGILGAQEILSNIPLEDYSHICCAVGTGTTLAGIIKSAGTHTTKIGISVLKGTSKLEPMSPDWFTGTDNLENVQIIHEYQFGGYGKWTQTLIDFMNYTYEGSGIPTDFVYTGKLFYAIADMAKNGCFPSGSRILVLHTGGLLGNVSLAPGVLEF